ncbi:hypothetical protein PoMZ_08442 [Pyricularia oryzae]|uniref:Uncharacterized protein n=1 Tax=Pyricularia oryzae TaxID=318829 RepID=A0A4P7NHP8_PYROR|nr:hypothetical protein PoMZ_08442 [Pyricularia oryzae]
MAGWGHIHTAPRTRNSLLQVTQTIRIGENLGLRQAVLILLVDVEAVIGFRAQQYTCDLVTVVDHLSLLAVARDDLLDAHGLFQNFEPEVAQGHRPRRLRDVVNRTLEEAVLLLPAKGQLDDGAVRLEGSPQEQQGRQVDLGPSDV